MFSWFYYGYSWYRAIPTDSISTAPRNVSTMEVSQVLSSLPGVEEANVYGVQAGISGSQGWWLHSNLQKGKKSEFLLNGGQLLWFSSFLVSLWLKKVASIVLVNVSHS